MESHQARRRLNLDVVIFREGEYWVGHCIQLGIATSGTDTNKVFKDACRMCAGQIEYALHHDPEFTSLFRPAAPDLLAIMAEARLDGSFDIEINSTVIGTEVTVQRRQAA